MTIVENSIDVFVKVSSDMWLLVVVSSYAVTIVQVLHSINQ